MLKSKLMVHWDRLLMSIGYKYNFCDFIYFVTTDGTGRTNDDITHFYKNTEMFDNVYIQPVAHPQIVSKFYGSVSEIDPQNKSRQSYLALGEYWVTQCGWLRLCTTFYVVINITNIWKIFYYWVR